MCVPALGVQKISLLLIVRLRNTRTQTRCMIWHVGLKHPLICYGLTFYLVSQWTRAISSLVFLLIYCHLECCPWTRARWPLNLCDCSSINPIYVSVTIALIASDYLGDQTLSYPNNHIERATCRRVSITTGSFDVSAADERSESKSKRRTELLYLPRSLKTMPICTPSLGN